MRILFRTDSSFLIGTGHIIRCLAVANRLISEGYQVDFCCLPLEGNISNIIRKNGFAVFESLDSLTKDAYGLCIVDHYQVKADDEDALRNYAHKIGVIDDWGTRVHRADFIIDPSLSSFSGDRKKANPSTPFYSGKDWLILRPEFSQAHAGSKPRTQIKNVLLFFGGTDPQDQTLRYWNDFSKLKKIDELNFHFLISENHQRHDFLKSEHTPAHMKLHISPTSVALLMSQMDFYIGSGGTITWERMSLGLTGVVISVVDNQEPDSRALAELGFHRYLGSSHDISPEIALNCLYDFQKNINQFQTMSQKCMDLIDTLGIERILKLIKSLN